MRNHIDPDTTRIVGSYRGSVQEFEPNIPLTLVTRWKAFPFEQQQFLAYVAISVEDTVYSAVGYGVTSAKTRSVRFV